MAKFKAKARAVELLGKGQIADLPTAITELWKNGYDAYAKTLECKLFFPSYSNNKDSVFILSDDGFGMDSDDIIDKWLVLGTDSKSRGQIVKPEFGLKERPPMGEKGIGRLSVAYLGDVMLMLTKKENDKAVALFMDWRILDNYAFLLDDLNIPLFEFNSKNEFIEKFNLAKEEFLENLNKKYWPEQNELRESIINDIKKYDFPSFLHDELLRHYLDSTFHGTAFVIFKPHGQLFELADKGKVDLEDDSYTYLRTSLSGLHNDLNGTKKDFETHFYLYDGSGRYDVIDDFFTIEEMLNADHWLKGSFDEFGFFSGEIRIFNKKFKHKFRPVRPPKETPYGPFSIEWGFMEGDPKNSLLNDEEYLNIKDKLNKFGGLYIYRDNFRVLPYGRPDADVLEFELRRSKRAAEYFFSLRRFIGYIDISRKENPLLIDKAGREGFIQNKAFRDFRNDLMGFFIDIAARYLKTVSDKKIPEEELTLRQRMLKDIQNKFDRQKAAEAKKNRKTKKAFLENLKNYQIELEKVDEEIRGLRQNLRKEADALEINYNNYNNIIADIDKKREQYRKLKLVKPRGVKFTNKQESTYEEYQRMFFYVEEEMSETLGIVEETRKRVNTQNLILEFNTKFSSHIKKVENSYSSFRKELESSVIRLKADLKGQEESFVNDFYDKARAIQVFEEDTNEELSNKIRLLDLLCAAQQEQIEEVTSGFVNHVKNLNIDVDDDYLRGWYKEQSEKLEKRIQDYQELAQLGISIEIIDHQFNVMYSQMKDAIQNISPLSENSPEIAHNIKKLKDAFQHLEGNYKLLTPLYRTSRRTRAIISGQEIAKYIGAFFKNDFERNNIDFSTNERFDNFEFFSFDSIVKPVFLNIINNSIYWLTPSDDRKIRIECNQKDEILIMNSGERIDDFYLEDIFTLFFTRKRTGRGIGLYLAQKNLNSIGYEIYATNDIHYNKLKGACFVIRKFKKLE